MQAEIVLGRLVALPRRLDEPLYGGSGIQLHAPPGLVTQAEIALRVGQFLLGGGEIPFHRLGKILRHHLAGLVKNTQVKLRRRIAALGRFTIPFHRLGVILRHTLAGFVKHSQIKLRRRIGLFRRLAQPFGRLAEFLRHALAGPVADAEITLGHGIVLLRRAAEPFDGFLMILLHALSILVTDAEIALCLCVTFLRGSAHQLKRVPRFAVGGHYFSKPQEHNGQAGDFKLRIPLPLRAAACYKIHMAAPIKIGFLGAGKMATALAKGFTSAQLVKANQLFAADPFDAARKHFAAETGAKTFSANLEVAAAATVLILATKPDQVAAALAEISGAFTKNHLLISIAAGVTLSKLENALPAGARVIRVMPNTPALVGAGASAFALGKNATAADGELAKKLLSAVGVAFPVKENLLDAVTGLSGSGPAYVYQFIEALSDGGVAAGLPRDIATKLAAQTVLGGAKMVLETGQHPGALKDQVTSPGGTTIEGLHALEKGKLRATVISAVRAATEKSKKLGQN